VPTPGGQEKWHPGIIKSILRNEKYKGDALLQKGFTVDFLTKKQKTNEGEVLQYFVEHSHDAIINPQAFELVQQEYLKRYNGLVVKYETLKARFEGIVDKISDNLSRNETTELFIKTLKKQENLVTEFDNALWGSLLDYITVYSKDDVRFVFKDGTEIRV